MEPYSTARDWICTSDGSPARLALERPSRTGDTIESLGTGEEAVWEDGGWDDEMWGEQVARRELGSVGVMTLESQLPIGYEYVGQHTTQRQFFLLAFPTDAHADAC